MHHRFGFFLCWLTLLGGCASQPDLIKPEDHQVSLVFGYFDLRDAPTKLDDVTLKKYDGDPLYFDSGIKEGLFWHIGLPNGSYQVETFTGRGGWFTNPHRYDYGTRGRNETAVRIRTPGIYFLGAYRFVPVKHGLFEQDEFEMKPISTPSEKELLQRLLTHLTSDPHFQAFHWQIGLARQRLKELSR
jgi:hypothetical protein